MASKLTSSDIQEVTFQSDVDSYPLRDNFTNLKNKTNELVDEISAVSIGTTNAETTDARPYHTNLKNRLDSIGSGQSNYLKSGGAVTVNADTSKVDVAAGQAKCNGIDVNWSAATSGAVTAAAAGKHRIDCVVANSDNTLTIVTGSDKDKDTENITFPSIATTQLPLAWLYVDDTGAVDLTNNIYTISVKDAYGETDGILTGGVVTEQGTPDMSCKVSAGTGIVNNKYVTWIETNIKGITAPGSNTRLDYIVVDEHGAMWYIVGTAGASPDFPSVPSNTVIVGAIVTKAATASINTGVECFTFKNGNNTYFPNLYINAAYTATSKGHNNVIIDMSGALITGTLQAQGNVWIADYDNNKAASSGENQALIGTLMSYTNATTWRIVNRALDSLDGTGGGGSGTNGRPYKGTDGTAGNSLTIDAFNVYVYDINLDAGDGDDGATNYDPNDDEPGVFPDNDFGIGSTGGDGGDGATITIEAVDTIELLTGGTINLNGGDGGDGTACSIGAVGNLGGGGGDGGDGGDLTMTAKTITENGTLSQSAGGVGTGGVGSGGSNNNGNGSNGSAGSAGSKTSTTYDFTTGLPSGYADWLNPLYKG